MLITTYAALCIAHTIDDVIGHFGGGWHFCVSTRFPVRWWFSHFVCCTFSELL